MKKFILALFVTVLAATGACAYEPSLDTRVDQILVVTNDALYDSATFAPSKDQSRFADAATVVPVPPATYDAPQTTTVMTIKGGDLASQILNWLWVAFGSTIGLVGTAVLYKIFGYFGIQTTQVQRDQLQSVIVNGLNAAAAKAQNQLKNNAALDVNVKSQIVADAVSYAQAHASETIKALGMDPNSGQAVEAIKARISTAINDPNTPTPAVLDTQPLAPKAAS